MINLLSRKPLTTGMLTILPLSSYNKFPISLAIKSLTTQTSISNKETADSKALRNRVHFLQKSGVNTIQSLDIAFSGKKALCDYQQKVDSAPSKEKKDAILLSASTTLLSEGTVNQALTAILSMQPGSQKESALHRFLDHLLKKEGPLSEEVEMAVLFMQEGEKKDLAYPKVAIRLAEEGRYPSAMRLVLKVPPGEKKEQGLADVSKIIATNSARSQFHLAFENALDLIKHMQYGKKKEEAFIDAATILTEASNSDKSTYDKKANFKLAREILQSRWVPTFNSPSRVNLEKALSRLNDLDPSSKTNKTPKYEQPIEENEKSLPTRIMGFIRSFFS